MKCYIHDILHVGKGCELPLPLDMVTNLAVFTVKMGGWGEKNTGSWGILKAAKSDIMMKLTF